MPPTSPGQLPGGLVTLGQYLQENQPAINQAQQQLNAAALQPYTTALGQAETAAVPPTLAPVNPYPSSLPTFSGGYNPHAPGSMPQVSGSRPDPAYQKFASQPPPPSATLQNNPTAQANLNNATAGLQALGTQAADTTATAGGRQNVLTSMFGSGGTMPAPPGGGYTQGDAAFDAALTSPTAAPNTYAQVLAAEGKMNPGLTPRGGGPMTAPGGRAPGGVNTAPGGVTRQPVPGYANAPDAPSNPLPPAVPQAPAATAPTNPYTDALKRQRPYP